MTQKKKRVWPTLLGRQTLRYSSRTGSECEFEQLTLPLWGLAFLGNKGAEEMASQVPAR